MAQQPDRKGYIAVGLGLSYSSAQFRGDQAQGPGANLTLLNAGYTFYKGLGVTINWAGGGHIYDSEMATTDPFGNPSVDQVENRISYGALMVGPMYTFKVSETGWLDVKVRAGLLHTDETYSFSYGSSKARATSLQVSVGATFRQKFANRWCWLVSADHYPKNTLGNHGSLSDLQFLSLTGGIGFLW